MAILSCRRTIFFLFTLIWIWLTLIYLSNITESITPELQQQQHSFAAPMKPAIKKRWAIMMIGGARTYAFTRESFHRHVVHQTEPPMDLFVSTAFSNNNLFGGLSSRLLEMDSTKFRYDEEYTIPGTDEIARTQDRFQREQGGLLQMIDDYAMEQSITYDYIFYTRPDIYYEVPFNISHMELLFEEHSNLGGQRTIFIPSCCNFRGWCDRLAAAPYDDFARMIRLTDEWLATDRLKKVGPYERAFKDRCLYANLTKFDMEQPDNYAFYTARYWHASRACAGKSDLRTKKHDMQCNSGFPPRLEMSASTCKFLNMTTWESYENKGKVGE